MNKIKNISREKILLAVLIVWLATLILPVVVACIYAVPSQDDFVTKWTSGDGNILIYMLQETKNFYLTWQGTYLAAFIGHFPFFYLTGTTGLRAFLVLCSIAFFAAFILLTREACYWMGIDSKNIAIPSVVATAVMLVFIISGSYENEFFYWQSGVVTYTVPLTLSMFASACYIAYEKGQKNRTLVAGCILAILGAGGALCVSALSCALLLFFISYDLFIKKTRSKNILIGIFALAGSLINTLAPGNYVRNNVIDDTGLHPLKAVNNFVKHFIPLLYEEFQDGLLLIVLVVIFLIAYAFCKNSQRKFKLPLLVTLYACFAMFIVEFPVLLGYSSFDYWPSRVAFIERFSIVIFLAFCAAYWGGYFARKEIFSFTKEHYAIVALILLAVFSKVPTADFGAYRMLVHLAKGDFAAFSDAEMNMLEQIEAAGSGDVTVYYDSSLTDGTWCNLMEIGFQDFTDWWINESVAEFYGVDSVTVVYPESTQ